MYSIQVNTTLKCHENLYKYFNYHLSIFQFDTELFKIHRKLICNLHVIRYLFKYFFLIDATCVFIFIFKDMDKDEKILQSPRNFNVARQIFRIITKSIIMRYMITIY